MPRVYTYVLFVLLPATLIFSSCSQVKFSANSSNDDAVTPFAGAISCSPQVNGNTATVTLPPGGTNPSLDANCNPTTVSYNWSVTRSGGGPVTINGLSGANSTPDFLSAGPGTYLISLNATSSGWTDYNSGTPLQVIVQAPPAPLPQSVQCTPRLNGTQTSVTLLTSANPTVTGSCIPAGASYVWTVRQGTTIVTVPGLTGSSSTPNFHSMGPGVYEIWLDASMTGYNNYASTTPLTVTVPTSTGTPVNQTVTVTTSNNKLDILLIVDDSSSMLADNQHLASRLQGFVNDLTTQGFDWQMCVTLTRAQQISANSAYYWGASYNWAGNPNATRWILKSGTPNINNIFTDTINNIGAGWAGTNDERAIKAAWWHLWNGEPGEPGTSGCYRADAGLAVLILSDEDERSIGGDQTQAFYNEEKNLPLESDDLPSTYVAKVRQVFGTTKRFTVNSIIVRPGDTACLAQQDAAGSKSHYGVKYNELSALTGGYVGSICAADYSSNLTYFKDVITRSQASVPLQCTTPVSAVTVNVTPAGTYSTNISNGMLVFTPQVPSGSTINLNYTCP